MPVNAAPKPMARSSPTPAPRQRAGRTQAAAAAKIARLPRPAPGDPAADGSAQGIRRTFAILRVVAGEGGKGLRLSDIAARAGLHLATTHRMLRSLALERAVVYDPFTRLYHVGHDFLQQEHETLDLRLRNHFMRAVQRVSQLTQDAVFLGVRHGDDALYIHCAEAQYPPADLMPIGVGGRRPLGVGGASLCLLAALPPRDCTRAIEGNTARYPRYGTTAQAVKAKLRAYRREGFAFEDDSVVPGLAGVGVPLHDDQGAVVAAMSVLTTSHRLAPERQHEVVRCMRAETARVGEFPSRAAAPD